MSGIKMGGSSSAGSGVGAGILGNGGLFGQGGGLFGGGTGGGQMFNPMHGGPMGGMGQQVPQSSSSPNSQPQQPAAPVMPQSYTPGAIPGIPNDRLQPTMPGTYHPSTYTPGQETDEQEKRRAALEAMFKGA